MCQAIQDMLKEAEVIGEKRGEKRGELRGDKQGELRKAKEAAQNFYKLGIDIEIIVKGVEYPLDTVKQWLGLVNS